jgi:hypothetical protein
MQQNKEYTLDLQRRGSYLVRLSFNKLLWDFSGSPEVVYLGEEIDPAIRPENNPAQETLSQPFDFRRLFWIPAIPFGLIGAFGGLWLFCLHCR